MPAPSNAAGRHFGGGDLTRGGRVAWRGAQAAEASDDLLDLEELLESDELAEELSEEEAEELSLPFVPFDAGLPVDPVAPDPPLALSA